MTMEAQIVTTVTAMLLNKYRLTGIPELDIFEKRSVKFLLVGLVTKNRGG